MPKDESFSHEDIIRFYEKNLTPFEQGAVQNYFAGVLGRGSVFSDSAIQALRRTKEDLEHDGTIFNAILVLEQIRDITDTFQFEDFSQGVTELGEGLREIRNFVDSAPEPVKSVLGAIMTVPELVLETIRDLIQPLNILNQVRTGIDFYVTESWRSIDRSAVWREEEF